MSEVSSPNENSGGDAPVIDAVELQKVLPARYRVLEVIGQGGAGVVYKAHDTALNKVVAIKMLRRSANSLVAVRFQREAQLAGSLNHPNVLSVIDFGLTENNDPYLVLEYVRGESLGQRLKRKGALPVEEALDLFLQIAGGLSHAHNRSIIHRDIKPSNVMLVKKDGGINARIVDFGLATSRDDQQQLTAPGTGLGTPTYMSPEQIRGTEQLDQRSDIYSFGCLMFQILAGRPPFLGSTAIDTIQMHLNDAPPDLSSVSTAEISLGLNAIVLRCLAKKPDDRFATVEEISKRLTDEVSLLRFVEERTEPTESLEVHTDQKKQGGRAIPIIVLAASLVLGVGIMQWRLESENQEPMRLDPEIKSPISKVTSNDLNLLFNLLKPKENLWQAAEGTTNEQLAAFAKSAMPGENFGLDLSMSDVTPDGLKALEHSSISVLIYRATSVTRKSLQAIAQIKSLKIVKLGETNDIDPEAIQELAALPKLGSFALNKTHITQEILENICTLKELPRIDLSTTTGTSVLNWEPCNSLKKLFEINLNDTDIDVASIKKLRCLERVRRIDLINTAVNDDCLAQLVLMRSLKQIQFSKSDNCTKKGFELLKKHKIEALLVNDTRTSRTVYGE